MKKTVFLLAFLSLLAAALPIHASDIRGGDNVRVNNSVNENLYVAGGNVKVNADVNGDLIGAGGDIWVNGLVNKDITLAGGNIRLQSVAGEDVRIAGGQVTISENVKGDLMVTGGELRIEPGVVIEGDIHIAGGKVTFAGTAKGNIWIVGGEVYFNGVAEQQLSIKGGKLHFNGEVKGASQLAAEEIYLGADTRFHGNVEYWKEKGDADFDKYLQDGATAKFNSDLKFKTKIDQRFVRKGIAGFMIYRIVSAALLISLLVGFFDKFFSKNTGNIRANIGNYLGTGTAFLFGVPIVAGLAFITLIGIPIGFIMISGYAVTMVMAGSLTAVIGAYEFEKYLGRNWSKGTLIAVSIVAFMALRLVGMMAFPGKLIIFVLTAIAIGSVIQWLRQGWRKPDEEPHSEESSSSADSDMV